MRRFSVFLVAVLMSPWTSAAEPDSQILFTNVNVFDGRNDELAIGQNVLVEGNLIKTISGDRIDAGPSAIVIDGAGRTLMPGLIDGHAHVMIN